MRATPRASPRRAQHHPDDGRLLTAPRPALRGGDVQEPDGGVEGTSYEERRGRRPSADLVRVMDYAVAAPTVML